MTSSIKSGGTISSLLAVLLVLAGCSMAPTYNQPDVDAPGAYKEAAPATPQAANWKTAQPSEQIARGEWWTVFDDAALSELEQRALKANQSLKAAVARVQEARAFQQSARVADSVKAAGAQAQQSDALLRSVQLALQADVAHNYFSLRELDAELDVYNRTVTLREAGLKLVKRRYTEGQISELDVARAESELATARSDTMTVQRLRAASEHCLAVLLGEAPAAFSFAPHPLEAVDIRIAPGLPSSLLERRPDIAAAERRMAAANARIGVARSAFFPSLTLTGAGGFASGTAGDLFNWSSRTLLLGPLALLPLFDGGRREGQLASARAQYEEEVANYRQQVLVAFQEVEDNLSTLRILQGQVRTQSDALRASTRAAQLSRTQYTEGAVNYLDVIDAERTVLQSQRVAVQLAGAQAVATVKLIRALGGGWGDAPAATQAVPPAQVAQR